MNSIHEDAASRGGTQTSTQMKITTGFLALGWMIASVAGAATLDRIGSGHNWMVEWQPIHGLNDGVDAGVDVTLDFVGDSSDATAYYADSGTYLYFRMRLATDTAGTATFSGAHLVMIDLANYIYANGGGGTNSNGTLPDFAFGWDSKSNDPIKHGLEMLVISTVDNIWNGINFDDLDGSAGQKLAVDINGGGRTTDGYVRTVDTISTQNLGLTTYLDYSVSWNYLETYTDLTRQQFLNGEWTFALGSIANATDHNNLNADIGGGASASDPTTSGFSPIPEPDPNALLLIAITGALILGRRRSPRGISRR